ncbi:hypothetical protein K7I13_00755 [Brucepastera parasyntrophica]|uniref:hypothetical protein n=1 Tax=Brucepastera parasyntrophica TaxID=2880008 RepID=UPI00210CD9AC|nr:hypothetical protein [Brucepastera parasyntrophica]ULQ59911.1 hypothetical protein K7I13_00755 [Brucepastera parasyntrophica]
MLKRILFAVGIIVLFSSCEVWEEFYDILNAVDMEVENTSYAFSITDIVVMNTSDLSYVQVYDKKTNQYGFHTVSPGGTGSFSLSGLSLYTTYRITVFDSWNDSWYFDVTHNNISEISIKYDGYNVTYNAF